MGRLLVRARTGMASNHVQKQQRLRRLFGDQPLARRPSGETRCRPRRPTCRADRGSPRACINGRSGRGGAWRPGRASQQATKDRRLVSRRACGFAPCARQSTGPGPPESPTTDFSPFAKGRPYVKWDKGEVPTSRKQTKANKTTKKHPIASPDRAWCWEPVYPFRQLIRISPQVLRDPYDHADLLGLPPC